MKPAVLVTKLVYPKALEMLRADADVSYHESRTGYAPEALLAAAKGKAGIVCQLTDKFSADVLDQLPELKVVSNVAVGYDNIDASAAAERGILVTNTPGVLTETTADLAFTLLMAAARRLTEAERFLRDGQWGEWYIDLLCGYDIHGATLGLLGMGRIGQAVARRAAGFGMKTLYHNRSRLDEALERELGAEYVSFDDLLQSSDFLSIHTPLTPETRHIIGAAELNKMKKTAILVNTARGPVVNEAALARALADRTIASAGIDVFEQEPRVHPDLLKVDNVVLAPHVGSATIATRSRMCTMAAENCLAGLRGEKPPNLVNPEAWKAE